MTFTVAVTVGEMESIQPNDEGLLAYKNDADDLYDRIYDVPELPIRGVRFHSTMIEVELPGRDPKVRQLSRIAEIVEVWIRTRTPYSPMDAIVNPR